MKEYKLNQIVARYYISVREAVNPNEASDIFYEVSWEDFGRTLCSCLSLSIGDSEETLDILIMMATSFQINTRMNDIYKTLFKLEQVTVGNHVFMIKLDYEDLEHGAIFYD